MTMIRRILATTNEISLKGGNRRWFEKKLTANARRALADLPLQEISRPAWRLLAVFSEEVPLEEVVRRLSTVFGIGGIMPIYHIGWTLEDVREALPSFLENLSPGHFAVRCSRSDKSFTKTSLEVEREIGAFIVEKMGWKVQLKDPDLTVHLLIDSEGMSLWFQKIPGPGGLPSGSGGRASCLLSGGIDSPVAAYLCMKRGMKLDFIHFHSVPQTDPASLEKASDLVRLMARYQGRSRLALVPLLPIQEEIVARCPAEYRVLLYRRFMLRIAQKLAMRLHGKALITGESLGQVASQTIENLSAVEAVSRIPVLRPLIAMDKQQIIDIARRIGSFEISIRPHFDCCSFLLPEHPATKSKARQLDEAESELDIDALVLEALRATEIDTIDEAVPWDEIPLPKTPAGFK